MNKEDVEKYLRKKVELKCEIHGALKYTQGYIEKVSENSVDIYNYKIIRKIERGKQVVKKKHELTDTIPLHMIRDVKPLNQNNKSQCGT